MDGRPVSDNVKLQVPFSVSLLDLTEDDVKLLYLLGAFVG